MQAKVLVVDDEAPIRRLIERYLRPIGLDCLCCENVEAARQALSRYQFDLLLTDLMMPGDSGLDLILYAKKHFPAMGRIIMTGHNSHEIADEIVEAGVYGYLTKPLTKNAVYITLKNALRHSQLNNDLISYKADLERTVLQRTEKLKAIMDNLSVGVVMVDLDMNILELNKKMKEWFPNVQDNQTLKCYQAFINTEQKDICHDCPVVPTMASSNTSMVMRRSRTSTGVKDFRIISTPILDASGNPYAAIMLYDDMTEHIAMERDLRQAQKLESVGQLAAGIAHEINSPIQFVGDNLNFLQEAISDITSYIDFSEQLWQELDNTHPLSATLQTKLVEAKEDAELDYLREEVPRTLQESLDGVQRVSQIVKAMKEFSHPGGKEKALADINRILETTVTVCKNEWKYVATVDTQLAPSLPLILCHPGDIGQVFLNMIVNAAHAIEKANNRSQNNLGVITIETEQTGGNVQIRISDTGCGIADNIREKIFDPFFTTKERGKGTGQGLSIAYRVIVEKHAGRIDFFTRDSGGTTFIIELPLA